MRKYFQFAAWLVVTMLGACSGGTESKEAADTAMEDKPVVRLASVTSRDVDQIEEYTATVEAEAKNNIAPTSPGRIDRIFVEVGDHVSKGQKLVQMDAANLKQMKLQLENEETEFRRMDELYKVGGASKSEWDAAKTALDVRRTSYNNLLENTQLLSPIHGVVTARNFDNGDLYSSASTPVLVIEQITPVKQTPQPRVANPFLSVCNELPTRTIRLFRGSKATHSLSLADGFYVFQHLYSAETPYRPVRNVP